MPYKSDEPGQYIPPAKDKRVKLTDDDRARIKQLHQSGEWSQRALAAEFGVSRRLIQFITDEAKLARHREGAAERRKDGRYYDPDAHTKAMRTHRAHKHQLYLNGELIQEKEES